MVDIDIILNRSAALEEYVTDLTKARDEKKWEEFSKDKVFRRYVERTLHMATEACLDIANHIVSYEGYREPEDNKDVFEVLKEQGIIGEELTAQC